MGKYDIKTKNGWDLLTAASSLQKKIRRGDEKALYFAMEFFPNMSAYLWRRISVISVEDVKDPNIAVQINAMREAFFFVNEKKRAKDYGGRIFITKAIITLLEAEKCREADYFQFIYDKWDRIDAVEDYVYDCHTKKGRQMGKTKRDFIIEEQEGLTNNKPDKYFDDLMLVIDKKETDKDISKFGVSEPEPGLFD